MKIFKIRKVLPFFDKIQFFASQPNNWLTTTTEKKAEGGGGKWGKKKLKSIFRKCFNNEEYNDIWNTYHSYVLRTRVTDDLECQNWCIPILSAKSQFLNQSSLPTTEVCTAARNFAQNHEIFIMYDT